MIQPALHKYQGCVTHVFLHRYCQSVLYSLLIIGFQGKSVNFIYVLPEPIIANSKDAYEKYAQISYTVFHSNGEIKGRKSVQKFVYNARCSKEQLSLRRYSWNSESPNKLPLNICSKFIQMGRTMCKIEKISFMLLSKVWPWLYRFWLNSYLFNDIKQTSSYRTASK